MIAAFPLWAKRWMRYAISSWREVKVEMIVLEEFMTVKEFAQERGWTVEWESSEA